MRKVFIIPLLHFLSLAAIAQGDKLTLRQSVETAIANNLDVKQSDLQLQAAKIYMKQARTNVLPDLFGNMGHGINQGRSIDPFTNSYINQQVNYANYSLGTSMTLFNGGRLQNSIRQNALGYEAARFELEQAKENLTLNVILAYLQILNNEDQVAQAKNQADVTRRQVQRLEILNKSGAVTPALFYDLKGQLANDELSYINNQNTLNGARLTLSQLMNVPFNKNVQLEKLTADQLNTGYDSTPDQIYEQALNNLAIVKAAEYRRQSAEKGVKVAKADFFPRVALGGNLFTNYSSAARKDVFTSAIELPSGDFVEVGGTKLPVVTTQKNYLPEKIRYADQFNNNYSTSVSIAIRIPILNTFRAKNQLALARIDLKNTQFIAETRKVQLKQSIEQAYFNVVAAYQRYTTLVQQVDDFAESFRSAEIRFNVGASTEVDYMIAKNNLDRANINLIIAKYDYILRAKILDYYQGKLIF